METQVFTDAKTLNNERNQRAVLRIVQGFTDTFITDRHIAEMMNQDPDKFERVVRLCIRELRRQGYPIVSESGKGYKWPASLQEGMTTVYDLRSRASDMHETANSMERAVHQMFAGQERMPI